MQESRSLGLGREVSEFQFNAVPVTRLRSFSANKYSGSWKKLVHTPLALGDTQPQLESQYRALGEPRR